MRVGSSHSSFFSRFSGGTTNLSRDPEETKLPRGPEILKEKDHCATNHIIPTLLGFAHLHVLRYSWSIGAAYFVTHDSVVAEPAAFRAANMEAQALQRQVLSLGAASDIVMTSLAAGLSGKCEQCDQMFGQFDRYAADGSIPLRCSKTRFNPATGEREPDGSECFPCEAGWIAP